MYKMEGGVGLRSTTIYSSYSALPLKECSLQLKNKSPLVTWAQLRESGSHLAVCLLAGPELLGTDAWGTRVDLEPGHFVPRPRDFRGWPILALERLNRDFSE